MKNAKQYYKELGRLVYAVAAADGIIQPEERARLHEFVMKELATHEPDSDSSGMNKAFYVDFEFEDSAGQAQQPHNSVLAFNRFVSANHEPGDEALLKRSILLLENVANAYNKQREKDIINAVKDHANILTEAKSK